jgi:hypothetical protein
VKWFLAYLLLTACGNAGGGAPASGPEAHDAAAHDAAVQDAAVQDAAVQDAALSRSSSYDAVREILTRSCTYERCHSGVPIGGNLDLTPGIDYAGSMVDVPSCEYPPYLRVKPGDPDHSWVIVKLTSHVRPRDDALADYILFEPEPGWDERKRVCRDHADDGTPLFGQRMPLTAPNMLPSDQIETIRNWIASGAPH